MPSGQPTLPVYFPVLLSSTFSPSYPQWSRMNVSLVCSCLACKWRLEQTPFLSTYLKVQLNWQGSKILCRIKSLRLKTQCEGSKDYIRGKGKFQKVLWKLTCEEIQMLLYWMSFLQLTFQECLDTCIQYSCVIVLTTIEKLCHTYLYMDTRIHIYVVITILPKLICLVFNAHESCAWKS